MSRDWYESYYHHSVTNTQQPAQQPQSVNHQHHEDWIAREIDMESSVDIWQTHTSAEDVLASPIPPVVPQPQSLFPAIRPSSSSGYNNYTNNNIRPHSTTSIYSPNNNHQRHVGDSEEERKDDYQPKDYPTNNNNNHNGQLPLPTPAFPSLPLTTNKIAKRACLHCRRLKVACQDQRPCNRCIRFKRNCVDECTGGTAGGAGAGASAGVGVRKRASPQVITTISQQPHRTLTQQLTTIPQQMLSNFQTYVDAAQTEAASLHLFSKSHLAVLIHERVRDTVLELHQQLDSLPLELPNLLEFHTQCAMMMVQISSLMTSEDFEYFLIDGLTKEQLNSPLFLSSPIAQWTRVSSRPLFLSVYPMTPSQNISNPSPSSSTTSSSNSQPAEFCVEWLPAANAGYQRWQRHLIAKTIFEREVRAAREAGLPRKSKQETFEAPLRQIGPLDALMAVDSVRELYENGGPGPVTGMDVVLPTPPTPLPQPQLTKSLKDSRDDPMDGLDAQFSYLDISPALAAAPTIEQEHDIVHGSLHAQWCPLFATSLEDAMARTNRGGEMTTGTNKILKSEQMQSVHHHSSSSSSGSSGSPSGSLSVVSPCICSLSTPLPGRVVINSGFEKLFGFRRIEVEQGLTSEGLLWLRRLTTPRSWPKDQSRSCKHWKNLLVHVGSMAVMAAREKAGLHMELMKECEKFMKPEPLRPEYDIIRMKHGGLQSNLYRRVFKIRKSDGQGNPSAVMFQWTETAIQNPLHQSLPQQQYQQSILPAINHLGRQQVIAPKANPHTRMQQ